MKKRRFIAIASCCMIVLIFPAGGQTTATQLAQEAPHLGLGIPADVLAYIHGQGGGGTREVFSKLSQVLAQLESRKILQSILTGMIHENSSDESEESIEAEVKNWQSVLAAVDWRNFFSREFAIGVQFHYLRFDFIFLSRVDPDSSRPFVASLTRCLQMLAALGKDWEVHQRESGGRMQIAVRSAAEPEVEICLESKADLVAISTSSRLLRQSLQQLEGWSSKAGILTEPAYLNSRTAAPKQSGFEAFFHPVNYFQRLKEFGRQRGEVKGDSVAAFVATKLRQQVDSIVDAFDMIDWISVAAELTAETLEGRIQITLHDDAEKRSFYPVFGAQKALDGLKKDLAIRAPIFFSCSGAKVESAFQAFFGLLNKGAFDGGEAEEGFKDLKNSGRLPGKFLKLLELIDGRVQFLGAPGGGKEAASWSITAKISQFEAARTIVDELAGHLQRDLKQAVRKEPEGQANCYRWSPAGSSAEFFFGALDQEIFLASSRRGAWELLSQAPGPAEARERLAVLGISPAAQIHCLLALEFEVLRQLVGPLQAFFEAGLALDSGAPQEPGEDPGTDPVSIESLPVSLEILNAVLESRIFEKFSAHLQRSNMSYHGSWRLVFKGRNF